jgi:hypothetical protein
MVELLLKLLLLTVATMGVSSNYIDSKTLKLMKPRHRDGKLLELVMSDEFETSGRSFAPGDDKMFEAIHKPDESNEALQFCKF